MEDTIDYGAVFGIDEGGNEQEAAAPANETEKAQGENEQEIAAPAAGENTQDTDSSDTAAETAEETEKLQTPEERSRFAAARRKAEAERDAAIQKAKEDAKAEAERLINEAFKNSGLTNPYTKMPINSKAEYDAYKAQHEAEKKSRFLKKSGMSDVEFDEFVSSLPEVQKAKQAQETAEEAARQAQEQQARLKIDEQLKEISALDPSVKELKDISKMPTYSKFYDLVKRGNTLVDAFKLANYEALTSGIAAASKQAAINAAQSKQHLDQTAARGTGAVSVPTEVREAYRAFNPNATEAEIQQHYNNYMKK